MHLRGRKVPGAVAPPELLAVTEPRQGPPEAPLALELRVTEEGWRAEFDVPARSRATGLRLRGGSPFLLDEVALARR